VTLVAEPVILLQRDNATAQGAGFGRGVGDIAQNRPSSTDESWSRSPRRITRALIGKASKGLAIIVNETIEASSTTTRSTGSGLFAWCQK
jgi:hypothetical protein